jgi:DNA repair exonuclease SbcCD ATPase subunit
MKNTLKISLFLLTITAFVLACGLPAGAANSNAVNTAVAGTQQASALAQATVNSSALTAMPVTPTPGPAVEYVTMTEEELTALIDQSVAEAVAATEQTSTAVATTTSDNTVTSDEVAYIYDYYYYAEYYVQYADEVIAAYYDLYGDLAYEMIDELNAIEAQLNQMNGTLSSIDQSLQQIASTLAQGLALAEESIVQLESAAQNAQVNAQALQENAQNLMSVLQTDQQGRLNQIAQVQPDNIPADKLSALQTAFSFIDFANQSMSDNKLTRDELFTLVQLGKNAQAGFQQFGGADKIGPDLTQFSGRFDEINTQFARGEIPQARSSVASFESSLGTRPNFGSGRPGGNGPRP